MAAISPAKPDALDENIPPPVYEVQEELVERRISTVPVANDRRTQRGPASATSSAPDSGAVVGNPHVK